MNASQNVFYTKMQWRNYKNFYNWKIQTRAWTNFKPANQRKKQKYNFTKSEGWGSISEIKKALSHYYYINEKIG